MLCSIIIATCNRARDLEQTLRHLDEVSVPSDWDVELIIADNASTDETAAVARAAKLKNVEIRYLYEGRKGKGHALNAALAQARGEIILFTDDDVAPATDWLEQLGRPLLKRERDCVVGRIELTKELCRPWMNSMHLGWLAVQQEPSEGRLELIGANMGVHRSVLDRVSSFDTELGPGALGFAEDTLFSSQLEEAGFKIQEALDAKLVHRPDPSRLLRSNWLSAAQKRGRCEAYILHHWEHGEIKWPGLQALYFRLKLALRRLFQPPPPLDHEGAPLWELSYLLHLERCRQFMIERNRPHNYEFKGLVKIRGLIEPSKNLPALEGSSTTCAS